MPPSVIHLTSCSELKSSGLTSGSHQRGYCWNSTATRLLSASATTLAIVLQFTFAR